MAIFDPVDVGILVSIVSISAGYLYWIKNAVVQKPVVAPQKMTLAELK
jgi:hypothetical protein